MPTRVLDDPGPLQVERLPDGRRKLLRPLRVDVSPTGNKGNIITVYADFCMDYSSLPWGLRWLMNWDRVDIAGVAHDYLYRTKPRFTYRTRWEADLVWFRIARSGGHGANWLQAALGLVGLYLGACWVKPARPKCTWRHKTVMAIVDFLLLGLLSWALCEWQLWLWMLIAVVAAVNLCKSKGRSSPDEGDREPQASLTTVEYGEEKPRPARTSSRTALHE